MCLRLFHPQPPQRQLLCSGLAVPSWGPGLSLLHYSAIPGMKHLFLECGPPFLGLCPCFEEVHPLSLSRQSTSFHSPVRLVLCLRTAFWVPILSLASCLPASSLGHWASEAVLLPHPLLHTRLCFLSSVSESLRSLLLPHILHVGCVAWRALFARGGLNSQWTRLWLSLLANFLKGCHWWFLPLHCLCSLRGTFLCPIWGLPELLFQFPCLHFFFAFCLLILLFHPTFLLTF